MSLLFRVGQTVWVSEWTLYAFSGSAKTLVTENFFIVNETFMIYILLRLKIQIVIAVGCNCFQVQINSTSCNWEHSSIFKPLYLVKLLYLFIMLVTWLKIVHLKWTFWFVIMNGIVWKVGISKQAVWRSNKLVRRHVNSVYCVIEGNCIWE